jgi:hypothetical protein
MSTAPGIDIPIRTKVDDKDVPKLEANLKALRASLRQAKAELEKASAGSPAFDTASSNVARLKAEIKALEGAATRAAGKRGGAGMGMLQLGQAVEDAQYGLRGVMNNIPGLVMSLGLGAGAAGGLNIALVAVSQLLDLIGRQSKNLENKPLLGELTFDEKVMDQARQFTELLERQRDAVQQRNVALRDTVEAAAAAIKAEQELIKFRRQVEDEDFVSTGDPVRDAAIRRDRALQRTIEDANTRQSERGTKLAGARGEQQNREQDVAALDAQLAKQNAFVQGVKQRAVLEKALQAATNPNLEIPKGAEANSWLGEMLGADLPLASKIPGFSRLMSAIVNGRAALKQSIDGGLVAGLQKRLGGLPMLPGFEATGNAEEDDKKRRELLAAEVERQRELQKLRDEAAREAETGKRRLATTEAATSAEAQLDEAKTAREQEQIRRRAEAETQRLLEEEAKKRQEQAQKEAAASDLDAGVMSARSGLNNMAEAVGSQGAGPDAYRGGLNALSGALGDGKGNTAAELEVVERMRASIANGSATRTEALQRALGEMERLQTGSTQMEQKLASVLGAYASKLQQISAVLNEVESRVNNIEITGRR